MPKLDINLTVGQTQEVRIPLMEGGLPALLTGNTFEIIIDGGTPIALELRLGDSSFWFAPPPSLTTTTANLDHIINKTDGNSGLIRLFEGKVKVT